MNTKIKNLILVLFILLPFVNMQTVIADESGSESEPEEAPASQPLDGVCSPNVSQILQDNNVTWSVTASGGSGSYTYNWSGDQGLSGSGSSITNFYTNPGHMNATVEISDGSETIEVDCDPVHIVAYLRFNSCFPEEISYTIGYGDTFWRANISGGVGPYTIIWDINDNLQGPGSTQIDVNYSTPGEKFASILGVTSGDGQTLSDISPANPSVIDANNPVSCTQSIMVYEEDIPAEGLQASCSANISSINEGGSVTWSVNYSGGFAPYIINWDGTDGLNGSSQSITTTYDSAGTKNASVTIQDSGVNPSFRMVNCGSVIVNSASGGNTGGGGGGSSSTGGGNSTGGSTTSNHDQSDDSDQTDQSEDGTIDNQLSPEAAQLILAFATANQTANQSSPETQVSIDINQESDAQEGADTESEEGSVNQLENSDESQESELVEDKELEESEEEDNNFALANISIVRDMSLITYALVGSIAISGVFGARYFLSKKKKQWWQL